MKKIAVLSLMIYGMTAFAYDMLPTVPIDNISPMQNTQTMQTQRFIQEEMNNYNKEKARQNKKNIQQQSVDQQIQQQVQTQSTKHSEFIQENGQIKIKYY